MKLPPLAIVNFSSLTDAVVKDGVEAVNCQIIKDFMPIWGMGRLLDIIVSNFDPFNLDSLVPEPLQTNCVLYLVDEASIVNVLAYHDLNARDIPASFVFVIPRNWTFALSHEVLEFIVNPNNNILLPAPDLIHAGKEHEWLLYSYEVCDPVERMSYIIDDYAVSNFVTPSFFQNNHSAGIRYDFLELAEKPFLPTIGSQYGVFNPSSCEWETILCKHVPNDHTGLLRNLKYGRDKPIQPSDIKLENILNRYNQKPPKGGRGLNHIHGISRLNRYRALVNQLIINQISTTDIIDPSITTTRNRRNVPFECPAKEDQ